MLYSIFLLIANLLASGLRLVSPFSFLLSTLLFLALVYVLGACADISLMEF
jgi:hypothetical protein